MSGSILKGCCQGALRYDFGVLIIVFVQNLVGYLVIRGYYSFKHRVVIKVLSASSPKVEIRTLLFLLAPHDIDQWAKPSYDRQTLDIFCLVDRPIILA